MKKFAIPLIAVFIALGVAVTGALAFMGPDSGDGDRGGRSFLDILIADLNGPDTMTGATVPVGSDNPGAPDAVSSATPGGGTGTGNSGSTGWSDDYDEPDDEDEEDEVEDD